jgi:hypothetical protein
LSVGLAMRTRLRVLRVVDVFVDWAVEAGPEG